MPIFFDKSHMTFKLDTVSSSYIIRVYDEGYLLNLYYGAPIPDTYVPDRERRTQNASFSPANPVIGEHGFTPDTAPMEYGTNGAGDFRIPALSVRNANGDSTTDIRYKDYRIFCGKHPIFGQPATYANSVTEAETLEIDAEDRVTGLLVTLSYTVFPDAGVMTRRVIVRNTSDSLLRLERVMSLCLDLPGMDYDMITLYGRHNHERSIERRPLSHGVQGVESRRGASGHCQNPFIALASRGADESHGDVYAVSLVYSGNHMEFAECDLNCTTRVIAGINPTDFCWHLEPGETFESPEAVMVFTDRGIGEMSRIFHRFYNHNLIRGRYKTERRPLLINSWEAAYFDFDADKLVDFAAAAKDLGIEMLVMDDGWFGCRNNDRSSLGDWYVNEKKLPGGLSSLIERVHAHGLRFGIWFEPEMISPDSDLFRAHPDWHVHVRGREPMIGRHQYVLDVSRADVRDCIWSMMYDVLSKNSIDYVKWDFNRNISDAASALLPPERQTEFFHRFILGTYDLMNRLTETFPDILLETCSGGGGRFDPAMLYYSPQIWTSDDSDPIERLYIQFGTSLCYPASCAGAHVSSNERAGFKTRGDVAQWGTFGYELDPRKLTEEERELVRSQVREYRENYDLVRRGDLYRLVSPFENPYRAVWEIVAPDKSRALLTIVTMRREEQAHIIVRMEGLDPATLYRNSRTGDITSGALLMRAGVNLSRVANDDKESAVICFDAVSDI